MSTSVANSSAWLPSGYYNGSAVKCLADKDGMAVNWSTQTLNGDPFIARNIWHTGAGVVTPIALSGSTDIGEMCRITSTKKLISTGYGTIVQVDTLDTSGPSVTTSGGLESTAGGTTYLPGPIIATSSTVAYVIYSKTASGSTTIKISKSTDAGATWSAGQNIVSGSGATFAKNGLAKFGSTLVVITWTSNTTFEINKSTDDGATWSSTSITPSVSYANLAFSWRSSTTWLAAYENSFNSSHVLYSSDGGVSWSESIATSSSNVQYSNCYSVHNTHEFVGHCGLAGGSFTVKESTDRATTWTTIQTVSGVGVTPGPFTSSPIANSGIDAFLYNTGSAYIVQVPFINTVGSPPYATVPYLMTLTLTDINNPDIVNTVAEGASVVGYSNFLVPFAEGSSILSNANFQVIISEGASVFQNFVFYYGGTLSDTISLTDSVSDVVTLTKTISDTISLTQSVTEIQISLESVSHTLSLVDAASEVFGGLGGSSDITITDDTSYNLTIGRSASDIISLTQSVTPSKISPQSNSNTISLSQSSSDQLTLNEPEADTLSITQSTNFTATRVRSVIDTISPTQAVILEKGHLFSDSIVLSDSGRINLTLSFSIVDSIGLSDNAIGLGNWHLSTSGSGVESNCTDPSFTLLTKRDYFTFFFPPPMPALTVVNIRNPQFGNTQEVNWTPEVRRSIGGQLSIAQGAWEVMDVLRWSFKNLSLQMRLDMEDFFVLSTGQEIGMIDQENTTWTGIVLTDELDFKPEGIGCQYSFDVEIKVISRSAE